MATSQNSIISYEDYLHFIYQCHYTLAHYFSDNYISDYATGPGADNNPQQSNGLRDKVSKLKTIIKGPFPAQIALPADPNTLCIITPSLPYTVDESDGTLVHTDDTYDESKITVQDMYTETFITENSVITAQLILSTLHAFYDDNPTFAAAGTKAGALHIRTPNLMNTINGVCSDCIVSCNVACGRSCAYNCGRSWACSNCRGSCRSCSGLAGCGTCGGGCTYHCGGGCAYNCSGQCNTCTGSCVNWYALG